MHSRGCFTDCFKFWMVFDVVFGISSDHLAVDSTGSISLNPWSKLEKYLITRCIISIFEPIVLTNISTVFVWYSRSHDRASWIPLQVRCQGSCGKCLEFHWSIWPSYCVIWCTSASDSVSYHTNKSSFFLLVRLLVNE